MTATTRSWRILARPGRGWRARTALVTGLVTLALCPALAGAASAASTAPRSSGAKVAAATLLNGVSCASAASCFAVGEHTHQSALAVPAIERLGGGAWSAVPAPEPAGASSGQLGGVWCTSPRSCMAVGSYEKSQGTFPLAERWDGTGWSLLAAPGAAAGLNAVSCTGARDCWAVGSIDHGSHHRTLTEHWNGSAWSIVGSPSVAGYSALLGVACPQASNCWAVGFWDGSSAARYGTLTAHWDGRAWSMVTTSTSRASQSMLNGISCSAASACMAVGLRAGAALTEQWNGSKWSTMAASVPGIALAGVSCTGSSACMAAGAENTGPQSEETAAIRWNGTAWSQLATPSRARWLINVLDGVACVTPADCWAVGGSASPGGPGIGERLIEHWDGTRWSLVH